MDQGQDFPFCLLLGYLNRQALLHQAQDAIPGQGGQEVDIAPRTVPGLGNTPDGIGSVNHALDRVKVLSGDGDFHIIRGEVRFRPKLTLGAEGLDLHLLAGLLQILVQLLQGDDGTQDIGSDLGHAPHLAGFLNGDGELHLSSPVKFNL